MNLTMLWKLKKFKKTKTKKNKKRNLLNEPRQYSQEKKLLNRSPTRLQILSHQWKAHHSSESYFRTGARTVSDNYGDLCGHTATFSREGTECQRHEVLCHFHCHGQTLHSFSLPQFYPLFCPLFILLFLSLVSTPVWTTCLCNLTIVVYPNPGWLCYMRLLVSYVICLCVTGMVNIINVPYTWVYHRLFFFPPLPKWWWL